MQRQQSISSHFPYWKKRNETRTYLLTSNLDVNVKRAQESSQPKQNRYHTKEPNRPKWNNTSYQKNQKRCMNPERYATLEFREGNTDANPECNAIVFASNSYCSNRDEGEKGI